MPSEFLLAPQSTGPEQGIRLIVALTYAGEHRPIALTWSEMLQVAERSPLPAPVTSRTMPAKTRCLRSTRSLFARRGASMMVGDKWQMQVVVRTWTVKELRRGEIRADSLRS